MLQDEHKATPKSRSTSSPHLEEILIGGMVDLDLLSWIPKFGQESLEGLRGIKLTRLVTMEERGKQVSKVSSQHLGKKEAIYSLPQNLTVTATGGRNFQG